MLKVFGSVSEPKMLMSLLDLLIDLLVSKMNTMNYELMILTLFPPQEKTYNCHKKTEHLENSFMLKQIIAEPTRVTPTSSTLIDLLLISRHLHPTYSGVLHQCLSDRYGIYVSLPVRPQSEPSKTVTLRKI